MTTRDRLLAILKEPDRVLPCDYVRPEGYEGNINLTAWATEINARHRLKKLCEELAKVALSGATIPFGMSDFGPGTITRAKTPEEIAAAIIAIGEDNEHS